MRSISRYKSAILLYSLQWNSSNAVDHVVYYQDLKSSTVYNATTADSEYRITGLSPFIAYHITIKGRSALGETTTTVGRGLSVVRTAESGKFQRTLQRHGNLILNYKWL